MAAPDPDVPVDITHVAHRKFAALGAHASQTNAGTEEAIRGFLSRNAEQAGWPGRLAEAFVVVRT
jgi:LmbE family N-acetylglucosaminyl deacetylase